MGTGGRSALAALSVGLVLSGCQSASKGSDGNGMQAAPTHTFAGVGGAFDQGLGGSGGFGGIAGVGGAGTGGSAGAAPTGSGMASATIEPFGGVTGTAVFTTSGMHQ